MLPLRDRNRSGVFPAIMYLIIALNTIVFLFEVGLPDDRLMRLVQVFGLVPARVTEALRGHGSLLLGGILPAFTSMFLHGGWIHLIGNMWFLHIFGDNVEGRLGHGAFLPFYLVCGLLAGATQYYLDPLSKVPMIGASGAIAGILGAYAVTWPAARILTLVPIFFLVTFMELPAFFVLGFWFLIQFLQGALTIGVEFAHGGVATWAHVGGFISGAVLIKLLPRRRAGKR